MCVELLIVVPYYPFNVCSIYKVSFLILLMWVFSFIFFVSLASDLPILLIFSKKQLFGAVFFSIVYVFFIDFCSYLFKFLYLFCVYFVLLVSCGRSLDYWFEVLFLPNVRISCYKFSSRHCFICALQILICCVFIFIQFKVSLKISLETSFLIHGLFRHVLFNLQVFSIFLLSFCYDFYFDSLVVREHTLHDFNSYTFVVVCLIWSTLVRVL